METSKNFVAISDIGLKRKNNEDVAYLATSQYGTILLVADGMGGSRKGEIASKLVADNFSIAFNKLRKNLNAARAKKLAFDCLKRANKSIYTKALSDDFYEGMGTTCVCSMITSDGTYIVSLGDSRLYSYKSEYGLVHQTTDQTYVELLFETGKINRDEMKNHPQKNYLINAVGINPYLTHVQESLIPNDSYKYLLLCSDGLYNMVSDDKITEILELEGMDCQSKAQRLLDEAIKNGGLDNIAICLWENKDVK